METGLRKPQPGTGELFITWLLLGIQSFGGGSSTFLLIHQTCMKRKWLSEEDFVRAWALAQIAPGINLVKLTMMLGYQLHGWPGLAAAAAGLLLPSAAVTVLLTAGFATIRSLPLIQAIMKGILPATVGLSLAMGVQMAQPLFTRAHLDGRARLIAHILIVLGAALLLGLTSVSPIAVLMLAGAAAVLLFVLIPAAAAPEPLEEKEAL